MSCSVDGDHLTMPRIGQSAATVSKIGVNQFHNFGSRSGGVNPLTPVKIGQKKEYSQRFHFCWPSIDQVSGFANELREYS